MLKFLKITPHKQFRVQKFHNISAIGKIDDDTINLTTNLIAFN